MGNRILGPTRTAGIEALVISRCFFVGKGCCFGGGWWFTAQGDECFQWKCVNMLQSPLHGTSSTLDSLNPSIYAFSTNLHSDCRTYETYDDLLSCLDTSLKDQLSKV